MISPNWRFIADVRAGTLANFTWITPVWTIPTMPTAAAVRPLMGCGAGQHGRQEQVLGFHGNLRHLGRLGRDVRSRTPRHLDRDSLGFRVPLLAISPYAKQGYVSHTHYETASVLRFAEDLFGLPQMAPADKRAASPADCFDFSKPPRAFVKIQAPLGPKFFMQQYGEYQVPDYE